MKKRKIVLISVVFRLGIILFCFTLFYMHKALGQRYFNPSLSVQAQRRAVRGTVNLDVRNQFGMTGLMFAAVYGERELAKALIAQGASLNLQSTKYQNTALHFAMNNMRVQASRDVGIYLVDAYANTRLKNKDGDTPLHLTIATDVDSDWIAMVERLIKNGASMNVQNNQGDTLLHLAVNMKKDIWVKTLLSNYGPLLNLNIKNNKGLTPYEYAEQLGFTDLARLFQAPIQPITKATARDKLGLTGLILAIMRGDQNRIQVMAKNRAAINLRSDDPYQNSALHVATMFEDLASIALLVKSGASRMIKNNKGEIPLQYVVRISRPKLRMRAAAILLNGVPKTLSVQNNRGETLLHYIVRFNDSQLLAFLVKRYSSYLNVSIQNKSLQTPIQLAYQLRRQRMIPMLTKLR